MDRITRPETNISPTPAGLALGQRIREMREVLGLSKKKLGKLIGRDAAYVSRLERGAYKRPTLESLYRLAGALGLEYAELVALTGQRVPEDLPSLTRYLAKKYELDDATARKLAAQFKEILDEYQLEERSSDWGGR